MVFNPNYAKQTPEEIQFKKNMSSVQNPNH